jgi:hypothetical protein
MQVKPTGIPLNRRQRLVTRSGDVLERAYVFLPAETWAALKHLCNELNCSNSKAIEMLVNNANSGKLKGNNGSQTFRGD